MKGNKEELVRHTKNIISVEMGCIC